MLARARAVTLTNYHEVARYVGLDPYAMLSRVGLQPIALRDPENWLPAGRILSLLEDSAAQSGRDDFGVLLGESRTFASLGPVSLLLRHESNMRQIVMAMIEYRRLINELLHLAVRDDGRSAIIEWSLIPGLRSVQGINLLATIAYRVLADGAGCGWQPDCIHFRHGPPRELATFKRIFRCALEFDSALDGMSCTPSSLDAVNAFAEPGLTPHARRLLNLMPAIRLTDSTRERTISAISLLLPSGGAHAEGVAQCLGIPVRTLQRRLIAEGQPFSSLLNETRRELAIRYLSNSTQSITTVAQLVGYSALSSFTRWFVTEFGMSPVKWRRVTRKRSSTHLDGTLDGSSPPRNGAAALVGQTDDSIAAEANPADGSYRIFRYNDRSTVAVAENFKASSEAAAVAEAYRRARGSRTELWHGQRRLAEIDPTA